MRKAVENSVVKTMTSDVMHRLLHWGCESKEEREAVMDRYGWDENKRIYKLKENNG